MTGTDILCGNIFKTGPKVIAERAAEAIMGFRSARAVCIDPKGVVSVVSPRGVCEYDLIGVWSPSIGLMGLYHRLKDEIATEARARGASTLGA